MSSYTSAASAGGTPRYELRSDLAQYCFPSSERDDTRKLAWVNSVCLLFLAVAILDVRQPVFVIREAPPLPDPYAAALPPPAEREPPPTTLEKVEETPEEPQTLEIPEAPVPVVVAPAQDVSFAVPVEGYVVVATNARFVPPPPAVIPKAPPNNPPVPTFRNIRFGDKAFRKQPAPDYPPELERQRVGGTVQVLIYVGADGEPDRVEVEKSSSTPALDRYVCDFIRREWRTYPGEAANFRIAITFAP